MKSANYVKRSGVIAGVAATLAFASISFSGIAQARDNVYWSVGVGSPGVGVNVGNAIPIYTQPQPVYVQPAPIYIQPQPVYTQPRPYYFYGQPQVVYVQPGPPSWNNGHGRGHDRHHRHGEDGGNWNQSGGDRGYWQGQGYAPIYYRR